MEAALQLMIIILAIFAFLPVINTEAWWIRGFDFPRLEVAVLTVVVFISFLFVSRLEEWDDHFFVIICLLILGYLTFRIFPYTPFAEKQVPDAGKETDGHVIKLMVSNVRQKNRDTQKCLKVFNDEDPDVLLAVETDEYWKNGLAELEQKYAYCRLMPLDNTYGMLLYSKLELLETKTRFLVEDDVPSIHTYVKIKNGTLIKLYCVHPRPPEPGDNTTERDVELLLIGKELKELDKPVIVFGDMNDVAWSHTTRLFQRIGHLQDPRIGRGFYNTYHAQYPFLRWPLDHFFHSGHFKLVEMRRAEKVGSDHFPVIIKLSYEPDGDNGDVPNPEGDDREEAQRKIEKEKKKG